MKIDKRFLVILSILLFGATMVVTRGFVFGTIPSSTAVASSVSNGELFYLAPASNEYNLLTEEYLLESPNVQVIRSWDDLPDTRPSALLLNNSAFDSMPPNRESWLRENLLAGMQVIGLGVDEARMANIVLGTDEFISATSLGEAPDYIWVNVFLLGQPEDINSMSQDEWLHHILGESDNLLPHVKNTLFLRGSINGGDFDEEASVEVFFINLNSAVEHIDTQYLEYERQYAEFLEEQSQ